MHITSFVALLVPLSLAVAQQTQTIFDAPVVVIDAWSRIDELLDLDLDGDLDGFGLYLSEALSSSAPTFMHAKLHRNDGAGRFTSSIVYQWPSSAAQPSTYRSAVGDVDGDGHADVVTLRGSELWVVESRSGQPTVRMLTPVFLGSGFQFVTGAQLCDLNDDGRAELITFDTFYGLRAFNLNATTWQQRGAAPQQPSGTDLAVFDANGDGTMEAAVVDGQWLRWYAIETMGNIPLIATMLLPPGVSDWGSPGRIAAGDLDNDLDQDLMVFGQAGLYCRVEQTAPGQFFVHPGATGGPAMYLHDFDGDGDLDGVCCGGGGPLTSSPNNTLGNFQVAENNGSGLMAPAWRVPTIGTFHLAGCADVDGDGRRDLVGGRCVYFGRGRTDPVPPVLEVAMATTPGDVDRDGDPDLIDNSGNQWTNRGDGTFASAPVALPPPPPGRTWSVLRGPIDFDQDGDLDVLADEVLLGTPVVTHLLRNQGGGLFVDAGAVTTNGTTIANSDPLRVADVDGDGDVDVLATWGATTSRVWLQVGGVLVPGHAWSNARVIGIGEFTGDGCTDVLLATYMYPPATGTMQLSLEVFGQSGGTPSSQWIVNQTSLDAPGIVDHDGDNDLDLIVVDWDLVTSQAMLHVFTNDGLGTFSSGPFLAPARLAPRARIAVADLDGNGLYDVVAGPAGHPDVLTTSIAGVWVARQIAPQQFTTVLHSSQFGWPLDADGDGDVDLVGRAVLRNTRFDGAAAGEREQFGESLAGTGGGKPVLGATGPFRVGGAVTTRLTGGVGQGVAVFVASFLRAPQPLVLVPGFLFYLDSPLILGAIVLDGGNLAAGAGSASFSIPILPLAAGLDFYQQAIVADAAGVGPGVTHSQALRVRIGW
ncbi:MAG: VCBS repeat-containing protein [Planctomycetota bacterium]